MANDKEINEGQLTPDIVNPDQDFAEARWHALSAFGLDKPSGNLVRDLESNKKVLLQRGLTIKRALPAPDMGSGIIQFVASTDGQKRDGNRVRNSGWHFENFAKNPVFLWCHDYRSLPIGRHVDWRVEKEGDGYVLRVWSQFCEPELYAFADKIRKMYEAGFLRAGSIGWNPLKFEILRDKDGMFAGFDFVENDLLEFSAVPVPSDPDAIVEAISRGIIGNQDIEKIQEYGQLPKLSRGVAYTLSNFDPIPLPIITGESIGRSVEPVEIVPDSDENIEEYMHQAEEMRNEEIVETASVEGTETAEVDSEVASSREIEIEISEEGGHCEELDEYGNPVGGNGMSGSDAEEEDDGVYADSEMGDGTDIDSIDEVISDAFSEAASKVSLAISKMLKGHTTEDYQTRAKTNFPTRGDDKAVSLKNSNWNQFDRAFAERIKESYPQIWKSGGNIYGNTAYRLWGEVRSNGGSPSTKEQEKWIRKREAWTARHFEDGRQFKDGKVEPNVSNVAGVVAQIKWGSIGTLGEGKMKDIIRAVMKKIDDKREVAEESVETRVGAKVSSARLDKMMQMREAMDKASDHMGSASNYLNDLLDELVKLDKKVMEDPHEQSPKEKVTYSIEEDAVAVREVSAFEETPVEESPVDTNVVAESVIDENIEQLVRLSSRLSEIEGILCGRSVEESDSQEESQPTAQVIDEFEARLARIRESVETLPTKVKPNTTKPKSEYVQSVMERIGLLKN